MRINERKWQQSWLDLMRITLFCRPKNAVAIELRRFDLGSDTPRPPTNRPIASELRRGAFGGSVVGISGNTWLASSSNDTNSGIELVLQSLRCRYFPWKNTLVIFNQFFHLMDPVLIWHSYNRMLKLIQLTWFWF